MNSDLDAARTFWDREHESRSHTSWLEHPEISNLIWLDQRRVRIGGYSGTTFPAETGISGVDTPASLPVEHSATAPEEAFGRARETRQTAYSRPFADSFGNPVFQAQIPLVDHGAFHGALLVEYSVERLLRAQSEESTISE